MKKFIKILFGIVIAFFVLVIIIGIISPEVDSEKSDKNTNQLNIITEKSVQNLQKESQFDESDKKEEKNSDIIKPLIKQAVHDKTSGVKINSITINPNLGNNANEGDKIVLIYLTWDVSNHPEMTRKMLEMYSARIVNPLEADSKVSEVVVFWEVPYHLKGSNSAKFNYIRKNNAIYSNGEWFAPVLR